MMQCDCITVLVLFTVFDVFSNAPILSLNASRLIVVRLSKSVFVFNARALVVVANEASSPRDAQVHQAYQVRSELLIKLATLVLTYAVEATLCPLLLVLRCTFISTVLA